MRDEFVYNSACHDDHDRSTINFISVNSDHNYNSTPEL